MPDFNSLRPDHQPSDAHGLPVDLHPMPGCHRGMPLNEQNHCFIEVISRTAWMPARSWFGHPARVRTHSFGFPKQDPFLDWTGISQTFSAPGPARGCGTGGGLGSMRGLSTFVVIAEKRRQ